MRGRVQSMATAQMSDDVLLIRVSANLVTLHLALVVVRFERALTVRVRLPRQTCCVSVWSRLVSRSHLRDLVSSR